MSDYDRVELLKKGYLTKSILKQFLYCQLRSKVRYVDGIPEPMRSMMIGGRDFHEFAPAFYTVMDNEWDDFQLGVDKTAYTATPEELSYWIFNYFKDLVPTFESHKLNFMIENFLDFNTRYYQEYCMNHSDPKRNFIPAAQEIVVESKTKRMMGTIDRISHIPDSDNYYLMEYKATKSMDPSKMRKELAFYYILAQDSDFASQITNWSVYNPLHDDILFEKIKKISITWMWKSIDGWDDKRGHHYGFWEVYELMQDEGEWKKYWEGCKHKFLNPVKCVHCGYKEIAGCWK